MNTHSADGMPIPSDWDIEQLELAELGQVERRSRPSAFQAFMSGLRAETGTADSSGTSEPLLITFDNELPTAYATPVCLLVLGAMVMGVVLFAV